MSVLELLAPAKNLECGMAAIDHGADAVYIGAPHFGARAAAGNSIEDIRRLCDYAHVYSAKVYVTVNTIVYDDELDAARQLLDQLAQARVDAILVQDMALLSLHSSLKYHASTQTDNRTPAKVAWLGSLGFSRVVLARELSLEEIRAIHQAVPTMELEVFVHGALCVSYSGLCYASQHCFGRSANRGECAQFCRMAFDLVDADGQVVQHNRHLLSLKDMNQIDSLEALADAGATSFKIEGRLKDIAYVKNVTAAYSQHLDQLVERYPERYCRASLGRCRYTFAPDLQKTFNRGYTDYFLNGRHAGIASFDTPKAIGQFVGTVKSKTDREIRMSKGEHDVSYANGDGLCFFDDQRQLQGFRVNRAEGNCLYPQHMPPGLRPSQRLYRNNDQEMEHLLSKPSAERKIAVTMTLEAFGGGEQPSGFRLTISNGHQRQEATIAAPLEKAQTPQRENIIRQLTKLGGTPYECRDVTMAHDFGYFIPASRLAELRRAAVACLASASGHSLQASPPAATHQPSTLAPPAYAQPHLYNISNVLARDFYHATALTAYELHPRRDAMLMQCRHCLRYSLGACARHGGKKPSWREPLALRLGDGRTFRLEFDCQHCQMNVYAAFSQKNKDSRKLANN